MAKSIIITRQEMDTFLKPRGFQIVEVPGTKEIVYSKIVDHEMCLRVYTSIVNGESRSNGEDAIRVVLVTRAINEVTGKYEVKIIGSDRRVHRVIGWRANLQNRLDNWRDQLGPACPNCGRVTVQRRSRKGPFWGCSGYPICVSIQPIVPVKAPKPVLVGVVPDDEDFDEGRAELFANGIMDID
jgi:hypothetical protein